MTKLSVEKQEELFAKDCKLINLRYEYQGYTGTEKWAVITELTEKELRDKYPDVIKRYTPFLRLSMAQGEVITEYQNFEAKERMRKLRFGHAFDINDGEFEEHHPEFAVEYDYIESITLQDNIQRLRLAMSMLNEKQKSRIIAHYFIGKTFEQIAIEDGVNMFDDRVEILNLQEENERLAELFSEERLQDEALWESYSMAEISKLLSVGEMLGLTWDCIDISEESLKENNASIFVDKELQRCSSNVMNTLDNKDVIRIFPRSPRNETTSLVLKTPKTKTSVRKIFLPSTVAQMLVERKKQIDEMKALYGDEYEDYNLVFCHSTGRPIEGQVINRALKKLIQDHNLPDIVFHSFRHASITYKLKWNGGDMKSVQGDSGHARMDMVAEVYSHIIDEDRRFNAQKFEEQFYNAKGLRNVEEGKTVPMPKFETTSEVVKPKSPKKDKTIVKEEKPDEDSIIENMATLSKLLTNPETAALLKALAKNL